MISHLFTSSLIIAVVMCAAAANGAQVVKYSTHVATVTLKQSFSRQVLQSMSVRKKLGGGYTFDSCRWHTDCKGKRACVGGSLEGPCGSQGRKRNSCLCLGQATQLCTKCTDCLNYPKETCTRDPVMKNEYGLCASSSTVVEGILKEKGCWKHNQQRKQKEAREIAKVFAGL